jgi:protease-4
MAAAVQTPSTKELAENWQEYADGRVLTGTQAYELGFVDELGNFETAVNAAERIAGIGEANIVRYQQPFTFADMFNIFGKSEPPVIKLELTPDRLKMEAGRMYFLSPIVAN